MKYLLQFTCISILALICFLVSIVLLPWSELGFNGNFPNWLAWAMGPMGISSFFNKIGRLPLALDLVKFLQEKGAQAHFGDYAYSLFMGLAITAAAFAIILVGKEDAEEKTILPIKK